MLMVLFDVKTIRNLFWFWKIGLAITFMTSFFFLGSRICHLSSASAAGSNSHLKGLTDASFEMLPGEAGQFEV